MKVFLRADKEVNYGIAVQLMALLQQNGVDKIGIMTEVSEVPEAAKKVQKHAEDQRSEAAKKVQKHAEEHRKSEEKKAQEATKKKELVEEKAKAAAEQQLEDILKQLKENYISLIAGKVRKGWRYQGAEDNWGCNVHIIQSEVGDVLAVNIQDCTIDNSDRAISFKNSIERAVYKASPLPLAPDKDLFNSEILFHFRVN
jgi:colicin import membrane protein